MIFFKYSHRLPCWRAASSAAAAAANPHEPSGSVFVVHAAYAVPLRLEILEEYDISHLEEPTSR